MANSRTNKGSVKIETFPKKDEVTVEVLYQKLGDRWFAFSLIDNEVFVGSITESELNVVAKQNSKIKKVAVQA